MWRMVADRETLAVSLAAALQACGADEADLLGWTMMTLVAYRLLLPAKLVEATIDCGVTAMGSVSSTERISLPIQSKSRLRHRPVHLEERASGSPPGSRKPSAERRDLGRVR